MRGKLRFGGIDRAGYPRAASLLGGGPGAGGGTVAKDVPAGWKDDGTTLTAPDGVPVVHGFRDWVLEHSWDAPDWPSAAGAGRAELQGEVRSPHPGPTSLT